MPTFGSFYAQGQEPFHLPSVQSATASGGSNEVEMALYVLADDGSQTHRISVQMGAQIARDLGQALLQASADADRAKGRP